MCKIVIFFFLALINVGIGDNRFLTPKIVGGDQVKIENYPYQVALLYHEDSVRYVHVCGATILSEIFCVTAAHCTEQFNANELHVRAGSSHKYKGGNLVKVLKVIQHEDYDSHTLVNDISILNTRPLEFNKFIKPANLPVANSDPADGTLAVVSGWGVLKYGTRQLPDYLRAVVVQVQDRKICQARYKTQGFDITAHMMCAGHPQGGKDACQNDSGGPLCQNNTIIGIVSNGIGCGSDHYAGVYTLVSHYRKWIHQHCNL